MPRAPDFVRHRLRNQRLTGPGFAAPADVVAWLGAVQSQDYPGAKWSVGQRVAKGTDAMVEDAFNRGHILRTHVLRPTWHFVTPADIRWMLELTAPHVRRFNAYWYRVNRVDQPLLARVRKLVEKALEGGNYHTRTEVGALLARSGVEAATTRLAAIMMHLELEGLVVSGPMRNRRHTYALLDERAPAVAPIARDEALARLAHRFFTGHGPATVRHFAWWSNLSLRDCTAGLAAARGDLTTATIDGIEWFGFADPPPRAVVRGALLVPEYDEALVGSRELGVEDLPHTRTRWTDTFLRPVLIDGRRAGTWRRHLGREVVIETNLFARLDPVRRAKLGAAIRRYGRFAGLPVSTHPRSPYLQPR
jgi:hypothetical protein